MMTLKPYLSLQRLGKKVKPEYQEESQGEYSDNGQTEEEKRRNEIFYLGISVHVPDGYVLYLSRPEKMNQGKTCRIPLKLFRASTHCNRSPLDFLISLDTGKIGTARWEKLENIVVEVGYELDKSYLNTKNPPSTKGEPFTEIDESFFVVVGSSMIHLKEAGSLLGEEGLLPDNLIPDPKPDPSPPDYEHEALPIEAILRKALIPIAVGSTYPNDPPPPPPTI